MSSICDVMVFDDAGNRWRFPFFRKSLRLNETALEKVKNGAVLVPEFVGGWATGTTCWGLGGRILDQAAEAPEL